MKQVPVTRICLVAALAASSLFAARPFTTDDAGTVAPNGFELELGTDVWQDDAAIGVSFKHGLTNRMDLGVGFGYTMLPADADGFENAEVVFKFAFIPDLFSASFTTVLGNLDYMLTGIVTYAFGPVELDMNLGFVTTGLGGIDGDLLYALAVVCAGDRLALGVEAGGDQDDVQSWLAGVRFTIFSGFALDGGIAGGFQEDGDKIITVGIHYEF
jgi:hypothetical protein